MARTGRRGRPPLPNPKNKLIAIRVDRYTYERWKRYVELMKKRGLKHVQDALNHLLDLALATKT